MKTPASKNLPVARFANTLAFNLSWNLNHREWNVVLYLVSKIDSKNQMDFTEQIVSVKELEFALKEDGKKWGGLYKEVSRLIRSLLRKPIEFYTDATIDGKSLPGGIPLGSIRPFVGEKGETLIRFKFHDDLKPLLLELHSHFVGIPQYKTKLLKSGHAIRFLIAAKAKRDMMREHERVSCLKYTVEEFKTFLGIQDKYARFDNFKRRVIDVIEQEINTKCDFLEIIDIEYFREGRQISSLAFYIKDLNVTETSKDWMPSAQDLSQLTWSQSRAYQALVEFKIKPGIAFRQLLPTIQGSEFVGYEDYFIDFAIQHFKKWTRVQNNPEQSAATFVNWWINKKVFETSSDVWSKILEKVVYVKKNLAAKEPEKFTNRQMAAEMTEQAFKKWYQEQQEKT